MSKDFGSATLERHPYGIILEILELDEEGRESHLINRVRNIITGYDAIEDRRYTLSTDSILFYFAVKQPENPRMYSFNFESTG